MTLPATASGSLLLALAYIAAGTFGLAFTSLPGCASAVWLPSGIALGALLARGSRLWPGVFAGAVAVHALSSAGWSLPAPGDLLLSLPVGAGATLQALFAAWLLRRREPAPLSFDALRSVVRTSLLWCPLACLVGASVATLALAAEGVLPPGLRGANWLTWWFGDWMGMVVAGPATLCLLARPGTHWEGRRLHVVLTAAVGLAAVLVLYQVSATQERARVRGQFEGLAAELASLSIRELEEGRAAAVQVRAHFRAAEQVDEDGFARFADSVLRRGNGVAAIVWAPRVPRARVAAFEAELGARRGTPFLTTPPEAGRLEPDARPAAHYPVVYAVPAVLRARQGIDLAQLRGAGPALARARDTGDVVALAPYRGVAGSPGEMTVGFVVAVPPNAAFAGGEALEGAVGVSVQPGPLLDRLLERRMPEGVALRLLDLGDAEPVVFYERGEWQGDASPGALAFQRRFEIGGRIWEFAATAGPGYMLAQGLPVPMILQWTGLLVTGLLVCVALVLSGRGARVEQLVAARTEELAQKSGELAATNHRLREEIAEREAVATRLRHEQAEREAAQAREEEVQSNFHHSLEYAQIGSWGFDAGRGLVTGTRELCRIYGLEGEQFSMDIGLCEQFVHPDDRARFAAAMRAGVESGEDVDIDLRILRAGGGERWVRTRARRKIAADGGVHILGVSWDISDEVAAESHTRLLAGAFERSVSANFIADAALRIVGINPAFTRLTGLDPAHAAGMDAFGLFSERTTREQFRGYAAAARERGAWQGEIWGRRGDEPVPLLLALSTVPDAQGETRNYVGNFMDVSELKRAREQAERAKERAEFLAQHDGLTGLPNRLSLQLRVEQALGQCEREGERLALFFIDMDQFKMVNDLLGHDVGDEMLKEIAARLRANVRSSDVVARLGGDEFVVALPAAGDDTAISRMAEKLMRELGAPYPLRGRLMNSSPSIGISVAPDHGRTVESLMSHADAAMYRAKELGRNNFQFFSEDLSARLRERVSTRDELKRALERDEFVLYYQPQLSATDGRYVAAEALIRWAHPERGLVAPDRFIGVAEEFGLIDAIGEWTLRAACREVAVLASRGLRDFRVCVNLSHKQLLDPELAHKVESAIAAAGIAPAQLELELTESVAMQDPEYTIELLERLSLMGVSLALDDFGTGYSSLSYLGMLKVHILKLDRQFVREIETNPRYRAICSGTVALAHALDIKVVAEGVETEPQRDFLLSQGCDYLQGWLFSKAVPANELLRLLGHEPPD